MHPRLTSARYEPEICVLEFNFNDGFELWLQLLQVERGTPQACDIAVDGPAVPSEHHADQTSRPRLVTVFWTPHGVTMAGPDPSADYSVEQFMEHLEAARAGAPTITDPRARQVATRLFAGDWDRIHTTITQLAA